MYIIEMGKNLTRSGLTAGLRSPKIYVSLLSVDPTARPGRHRCSRVPCTWQRRTRGTAHAMKTWSTCTHVGKNSGGCVSFISFRCSKSGDSCFLSGALFPPRDSRVAIFRQ